MQLGDIKVFMFGYENTLRLCNKDVKISYYDRGRYCNVIADGPWQLRIEGGGGGYYWLINSNGDSL